MKVLQEDTPHKFEHIHFSSDTDAVDITDTLFFTQQLEWLELLIIMPSLFNNYILILVLLCKRFYPFILYD